MIRGNEHEISIVVDSALSGVVQIEALQSGAQSALDGEEDLDYTASDLVSEADQTAPKEAETDLPSSSNGGIAQREPERSEDAIEEAATEGDTIQAPDYERERGRNVKSRRRRRSRSRRRRGKKKELKESEEPQPAKESHVYKLPTIVEETEEDQETNVVDTEPPSESEKTEYREEKEEVGPLTCLVARTALIIPFTFGNHRAPPTYWVQHLTERTVLGHSGESFYLWEQNDNLPLEVAELSRQFRQMVGWRDRKGRTSMNTWRCRRLRLTPQAHKQLFSRAKLWAVQREDDSEHEIRREVILEGIDLLLFPLGTGILVFNINWIVPNNFDGVTREEEDVLHHSWSGLPHPLPTSEGSLDAPPFLLEELRTWLYVAKFRHGVPHVARGWTFENPLPKDVHPTVAQLDSLGKRMSRALYGNKPISLNAIGNWLLLFNGENPSAPPPRVAYGGHAYHHSSVVVDSEPPLDTLHEYLFHLRRAYGQKNRPPPGGVVGEFPSEHMNADIVGMGPHGSLDKVLVPRLNRYIGISREGIVCMTWSTDPSGTSFDVRHWYKKFQGIYLILSLHAHGERAVLEELSTLAANYADNMKLESDKANIQEMESSRKQMKELATMVARFTISMSSDDCGGLSEYSEFFTTVRKVFGIPNQRAELREELQDTLALLDSGYLEERRRLKMEEQKEERADRDRMRRLRLQKEGDKHRYEMMVSTVSAVTIPCVLLSSIFGMNVKVPEVGFWDMIMAMVVISGIVLILQLIYLRGLERRHATMDE